MSIYNKEFKDIWGQAARQISHVLGVRTPRETALVEVNDNDENFLAFTAHGKDKYVIVKVFYGGKTTLIETDLAARKQVRTNIWDAPGMRPLKFIQDCDSRGDCFGASRRVYIADDARELKRMRLTVGRALKLVNKYGRSDVKPRAP